MNRTTADLGARGVPLQGVDMDPYDQEFYNLVAAEREHMHNVVNRLRSPQSCTNQKPLAKDAISLAIVEYRNGKIDEAEARRLIHQAYIKVLRNEFLGESKMATRFFKEVTEEEFTFITGVSVDRYSIESLEVCNLLHAGLKTGNNMLARNTSYRRIRWPRHWWRRPGPSKLRDELKREDIPDPRAPIEADTPYDYEADSDYNDDGDNDKGSHVPGFSSPSSAYLSTRRPFWPSTYQRVPAGALFQLSFASLRKFSLRLRVVIEFERQREEQQREKQQTVSGPQRSRTPRA